MDERRRVNLAERKAAIARIAYAMRPGLDTLWRLEVPSEATDDDEEGQ